MTLILVRVALTRMIVAAPAVTEDDRLSCTAVLMADLFAVFLRDGADRLSPLLSVQAADLSCSSST